MFLFTDSGFGGVVLEGTFFEVVLKGRQQQINHFAAALAGSPMLFRLRSSKEAKLTWQKRGGPPKWVVFGLPLHHADIRMPGGPPALQRLQRGSHQTL